MKVGSLAECTDNANIGHGMIIPQLHTLYTVREIRKGIDDEYGITLDEITNHLCVMTNAEWAYIIERFKEVQPPMEISIESLLEEPEMA